MTGRHKKRNTNQTAVLVYLGVLRMDHREGKGRGEGRWAMIALSSEPMVSSEGSVRDSACPSPRQGTSHPQIQVYCVSGSCDDIRKEVEL